MDLLVREGFSRLIPGGKSHDLGRDAEIRYWTEHRAGEPKIAFQFSMERKWETKLRSDIKKILRHCNTITRIVFVSSRQITNEKQSKIRQEISTETGIAVEIFEEGWFRIRLEEEHPDLALKHLGISIPATPGFFSSRIKMEGLSDDNSEELLKHTTAERLLATITDETRADPKNFSAWKALAHVSSYMRDYDHALFCLTEAKKCEVDDHELFNIATLMAAITAEKGIASNSRLILKSAEEQLLQIIFRLGRSIDYYNLANVQVALGKIEVAEAHYRRSLEINPTDAKAWNNLGTTLIKLERLDEGLACFDRALQLNPNMVEALCTKANVLVMLTCETKTALILMDQALMLDSEIERRWPHFHYWKGMALCRESRFEEALQIVYDRLERVPDCRYLGRLGADILTVLWRSDAKYIPEAERFFRFRIDPIEKNYRVATELLDILDQTGRCGEAWSLLDEFLGLGEVSALSIARRIPIGIRDLTASFPSADHYLQFRMSSELTEYAIILNRNGLRPHNDLPELLYHLLLVPYFRLGVLLTDVDDERVEGKINEITQIFHCVSRIFGAFGGALLAEGAPECDDSKIDLVSNGLIACRDFALIESSRLIGHCFGILGRRIPDSIESALVNSQEAMFEDFTSCFLKSVWSDWKMDIP